MKQLSANHTVIIFDNRGKGKTSVGTIKNMTMSQFANDIAGIITMLVPLLQHQSIMLHLEISENP